MNYTQSRKNKSLFLISVLSLLSKQVALPKLQRNSYISNLPAANFLNSLVGLAFGFIIGGILGLVAGFLIAKFKMRSIEKPLLSDLNQETEEA